MSTPHHSMPALRPLMLACSLALAGWSAANIAHAENAKDDQATDLDPVLVREHHEKVQLPPPAPGGQVASGAKLGLLGNTDVMDTPFNITAYTAKLIEDQQATTIGEVLVNDPSVRQTTNEGHTSENFTIRGFSVESTDIAIDGLYGLASFGHVPTEFLERVEVLKGPGALLSGMAPSGSVGGVISLVPKRAGETDLTRVGVGYVSDGYFETHADVSRRFGTDRHWGLRVNAAYGDGDRGVDGQSKTRKLASAALDYRGDKLTVNLDAFYTREESEGGTPVMVGFSTIGKVIAAPDGDTNLLRGINSDLEDKAVVLRGEYQFNNHWSAFASVGGAHQDYDGYLYGTRVLLTDTAGDASARTYLQQGSYHNAAADAGIRGDFTTGSVSHKVTLGGSYLHQLDDYGYGYSSAYVTNLYSPTNPTLATSAGTLSKNVDSIISSVALADVIGFVDDSIQLTVGARQQRVQQKLSDSDESELSPAVGLLIRPGNGPVSVYANYIEGLSAGGTVTDTSAPNYGEQFAPYRSKQKEVGVKWAFGGFVTTFDMFEITQPSLIQNSTTLAYSADGEQRNRGAELNVFGELAPDVRLLGGLTYTQAKLTRTEGGEYEGNTAYGVPKWTANVGGEWDTPWLPGLTLTARAIYTDEQYLNSANTLVLPDWVRFDAGVRYKTRLGGKPTTFRLGVDNIADKRYWAGVFNENYATFAAGRTYRVSASFDF